MALHEQSTGKSDEWYSPPYLFDALGTYFDIDVAHPGLEYCDWVPATRVITKKEDGLKTPWEFCTCQCLPLDAPSVGQRNQLKTSLLEKIERGDTLAGVDSVLESSAPISSIRINKMFQRECEGVPDVKNSIKTHSNSLEGLDKNKQYCPICKARVYKTSDKPFVWMNPPFGKRNGIVPWLEKFVEHGNGIALVPDRTSAPWFQEFIKKIDLVLFVSPKIRFIDQNGNPGKSPAQGTALCAMGWQGCQSLRNAEWNGLGVCMKPVNTLVEGAY